MSSIDPYEFLRGFSGKWPRPHPARLRRGTYTLLCNCHWQLFNLNSLRGAPLVRNDTFYFDTPLRICPYYAAFPASPDRLAEAP